jgi:hypothetical protein
MLADEDWTFDADSPLGYWDILENKIINVVDQIIPITAFTNNTFVKENLPANIKHRMNLRKILPNRHKVKCTLTLSESIKSLKKEIRGHFNRRKSRAVRNSIVPGNTRSLWKAVKIARDVNTSFLPKILYEKEQEIPYKLIPESFGKFFDEKILGLLDQTKIENDVYSGERKIYSEDKKFMTRQDIYKCIMTLKSKNSEGFERIPQ